MVTSLVTMRDGTLLTYSKEIYRIVSSRNPSNEGGSSDAPPPPGVQLSQSKDNKAANAGGCC